MSLFNILSAVRVERSLGLFHMCLENSSHFETLDDEQKFTLIIPNENECPLVTEMSVQFIFNSFKIKFCKTNTYLLFRCEYPVG